MSNKDKSVKGLKIGSKVAFVSFKANDLPPAGGFKGHIIELDVIDINSDTSVTFQSTKNPEKKFTFDFKDDTVNCLYTNAKETDEYYTGIYTDLKLFFDKYKEIYIGIKGEDEWLAGSKQTQKENQDKKED